MLKEIFLHRLPTAVFFIAVLAGIFWLDAAVIGADVCFTLFVMLMGAFVTLEFYRLCDGSRREVELMNKNSGGPVPPEGDVAPLGAGRHGNG